MNIPSVDMDELHPGGEVPESPDDRGETPYFHGRKNILDKFQDRLFKSFSNSGNGGTILLFQGPPGVGKTALLAECRKIAEANGWITAEINPEALWDMRSLKHCLGTARGGKVKEVNIGANMSIFGVNIGVVFNQDAPLPLEALTGDHEPLLLILDEAQRLGKPGMPPAGKIGDTTTILENIHNGKMKRPLVLLTAGLGDTLQGFQSLFISRFKNNCYYELKALTKGEERAIIEDWFQKQGRVTGDMTEWTHRIMEETYGWGHHIISYVEPALDQLGLGDGEMTAEGLDHVMEQGRKNRMAYYAERTKGMQDDHIVCLVEMFCDIPIDQGFLRQDLVSELGEPGFTRALAKGVLYFNDPWYTIPIPSMYDYMVKRAQKIREAALRYKRVKERQQGKDAGELEQGVQNENRGDQ